MGGHWQREKGNHHFPELSRKNGWVSFLKKIFDPWRLGALAAASTLIVGLVYLVQTSSSATQGYQIKDLEGRIEELQRINKKLNLEYAEMQSMANLVGRLDGLDLVAADNVEMVSAMSATVAKR